MTDQPTQLPDDPDKAVADPPKARVEERTTTAPPRPTPAGRAEDLGVKIARHTADGWSVGRTARHLGVSNATVVRHIRRLEADGLIERDRAGVIRRTVGKSATTPL